MKSAGARLVGGAWQAWWSAMRRYHRYSVIGLAHLERPGPLLIAGYHGRPIAHDLCMLQSLLREERGAEAMPRAIMHTYFRTTPGLRWIFEGYDFLDGDEAMLAEAVRRGDKIIVTPGGTREGTRSRADRYRVEWGHRTGYLRLALRHHLPVVPTAAWGVDDTYLSLNDGYALGKRAGLPKGLPLWLGIGPLGPWPLSPPWPVRITTIVGEPIDLEADGPVDPRDAHALQALHARVTSAVQALLDARHDPARLLPGQRSLPEAA